MKAIIIDALIIIGLVVQIVAGSMYIYRVLSNRRAKPKIVKGKPVAVIKIKPRSAFSKFLNKQGILMNVFICILVLVYYQFWHPLPLLFTDKIIIVIFAVLLGPNIFMAIDLHFRRKRDILDDHLQ